MRAVSLKPKRLDVRPLLARGEEPLPAIRRGVDALRPGQVLEVTAPFLPSPLIELLGSEGFRSRVERPAAGVWTVRFWREVAP
jgi:uncharacterized protein (DUF2249 family)